MLNKTYFIKAHSISQNGVKREHWRVQIVPFWKTVIDALNMYEEYLEELYPGIELMIDNIVRVE